MAHMGNQAAQTCGLVGGTEGVSQTDHRTLGRCPYRIGPGRGREAVSWSVLAGRPWFSIRPWWKAGLGEVRAGVEVLDCFS